MADQVIARWPPQDGREWDAQCARCGSSVTRVECEHCGGEGLSHHDCGEDSCCCLDDSPNVTCTTCGGAGGWLNCLSGADWCEANPLPDREMVERGKVEWFTTQRLPPAHVSFRCDGRPRRA